MGILRKVWAFLRKWLGTWEPSPETVERAEAWLEVEPGKPKPPPPADFRTGL